MKKKLLSLLLLITPFITFAQEKGLDEKINDWFEPITVKWGGIVFWIVPGTGVPIGSSIIGSWSLIFSQSILDL